MGATASTTALQIPQQFEDTERADVTLLELVDAICDLTQKDDEVVATVLHMLSTGRVQLRGNFRGSGSRDFS